MWITIPDREENNTFNKIKIGELFIDHSDTNGSGEEEVYMRTECVELEDETELNAVNLHSGELFYFDPEDAVEPIVATMNIKRGISL